MSSGLNMHGWKLRQMCANRSVMLQGWLLRLSSIYRADISPGAGKVVRGLDMDGVVFRFNTSYAFAV